MILLLRARPNASIIRVVEGQNPLRRIIISMSWSLLIALGLACVVLGCHDPTGYSVAESVAARTDQSAVELHNGRSAAIYFFIVDRQEAALINWAPCGDPQHCPRVAANRTVVVPGSEVFGWDTSDQVIVYWWHLIPAGDRRYEPDTIRALVVYH